MSTPITPKNELEKYLSLIFTNLEIHQDTYFQDAEKRIWKNIEDTLFISNKFIT